MPVESFWNYEMRGALIGAFLGGQTARIWAKWRLGQIAEARAIAFFSGAFGVGFYVLSAWILTAYPSTFVSSSLPLSGWSTPLHSFGFHLLSMVLNRHLPFLLCLLLFFGGMFAPRK